LAKVTVTSLGTALKPPTAKHVAWIEVPIGKPVLTEHEFWMAKFPRQYEWICNIEFLTEARLHAFKSYALQLLKVLAYAMIQHCSILFTFRLWNGGFEELVPLCL
jgi:hypothetical protein